MIISLLKSSRYYFSDLIGNPHFSGPSAAGGDEIENLDSITSEIEINLLLLAIVLKCDDLTEEMLEMAQDRIKEAIPNHGVRLTKNDTVRGIKEFIRVRDRIFTSFLDARIRVRSRADIQNIRQR